MKKIIIWALYDDAESSYKRAISKYFDKSLFEVHSIGINNVKFEASDTYFYHKIDLSTFNFSLNEQLDTLPKPDIILASPPCESWSIADCSGRMNVSIVQKGDEVIRQVRNRKYYDEYNLTCHKNKRRSFKQKEISRLIGEATIVATLMIIDDYAPKIWIIENPSTSLTWKYQEFILHFDGILNKTFYSAYNSNYSAKPTTFKSNIDLGLKAKKGLISNKNHMNSSYATRSSIPDELIKDILDHCLEYLNKKSDE